MLIWIALTALLLFSAATYMAARRKAVAATNGKPVLLHSLPGYYGSYAALWVGAPAALLILLFAMFGGRMEAALLRADPPAAVQALTAPQQDDAARAELARRFSSLTPQQMKILRLICQGKANKEISYELSIAEATVKTHITAIMSKINARRRTQAVLLANSVRLFEPA